MPQHYALLSSYEYADLPGFKNLEGLTGCRQIKQTAMGNPTKSHRRLSYDKFITQNNYE